MEKKNEIKLIITQKLLKALTKEQKQIQPEILVLVELNPRFNFTFIE